LTSASGVAVPISEAEANGANDIEKQIANKSPVFFNTILLIFLSP
jgi:hypothetical protein